MTSATGTDAWYRFVNGNGPLKMADKYKMTTFHTNKMVGGPADGGTFNTPNSSHHITVQVTNINDPKIDGHKRLRDKSKYTNHPYTRESLQVGNKTYTFWRDSDISVEQALQFLLENYSGGGKSSNGKSNDTDYMRTWIDRVCDALDEVGLTFTACPHCNAEVIMRKDGIGCEKCRVKHGFMSELDGELDEILAEE